MNADWNSNKFGVPYHGYSLELKNGDEVIMDVGVEEDWGNVQDCYTDWDGEKHRNCVGWGCEDDWEEIVDVYDCETETHLDPMEWAKECVWCYVNKYSA